MANGEIRIIPAAILKHALIVQEIFEPLRAQLDREKVLVLITNFGLIISTKPLTSRVPDLAVFNKSTLIEEDGYIHSAHQLAVEVLSPPNTRSGREERLADYASIGIPEVWIVSPEARTVEVLQRQDGNLSRSEMLAEGFLRPELFPGVQVDIAQIWA